MDGKPGPRLQAPTLGCVSGQKAPRVFLCTLQIHGSNMLLQIDEPLNKGAQLESGKQHVILGAHSKARKNCWSFVYTYINQSKERSATAKVRKAGDQIAARLWALAHSSREG